MIEELTKAWPDIERALLAKYSEEGPGSYEQIFRDLITEWPDPNGWEDGPDPDRLVTIDHGDYQGTIVFVVGAKGYQPWTYWVCKAGYGSCGGCDALEAIRDYHYEGKPTEQQAKDYVALARQMLQATVKV